MAKIIDTRTGETIISGGPYFIEHHAPARIAEHLGIERNTAEWAVMQLLSDHESGVLRLDAGPAFLAHYDNFGDMDD